MVSPSGFPSGLPLGASPYLLVLSLGFGFPVVSEWGVLSLMRTFGLIFKEGVIPNEI